jgi:hypothetical protein
MIDIDGMGKYTENEGKGPEVARPTKEGLFRTSGMLGVQYEHYPSSWYHSICIHDRQREQTYIGCEELMGIARSKMVRIVKHLQLLYLIHGHDVPIESMFQVVEVTHPAWHFPSLAEFRTGLQTYCCTHRQHYDPAYRAAKRN